MKARYANCCKACLLLAFASTTQAAVYHCVRNGKQVYTDTPCTPDAQPAQLPTLNKADPTTDPGRLARQYDRRQEQDHAARDRADDAWLKTHEAEKKRDARIRKGLVDGQVVEGMTPADVEQVLGVPASALGGQTAPRRWNYRNGRSRSTVNFKNGRVTSIRQSRPASH